MNHKTWLNNTVIYLMLIVAGLIFPITLGSQYWIHIFALIFIKIILVLSLRQMLLIGLLNLALVAFMAIGSYFSAVLSTTLNIPFWVTMPLSGVVCAFISILLAFPMLRLKRAYFFLGTVCFAIIVVTFFSNYFVKLFGGIPGFILLVKPRIKIFNFEIKFLSHLSLYYLNYIIMMISIAIMHRLEHSYYGQYWKAIGSSDKLAEMQGINLFKYKTFNFAVCSFFAGISGALFATTISIITPHNFDLQFMFIILVYLMVGGTRNFWGPIIGVLILAIIGEFLRGLGQYEMLGYGLILISSMIFLPKGIIGVSIEWIPLLKER